MLSTSRHLPATLLASLLAVAAFAPATVMAHEHESDDIPDGEYTSPEPLDSILWAHIVLMFVSFAIIFPVGMILGLTKNRFHVPVQVAGAVVTTVAWFLGHHHKGREFPSHNIHAVFANFLVFVMVAQFVVGVYLKLHLERGLNRILRKFGVIFHRISGILIPILAYVQMGFGGITALGFCHGDHLGQCLAHGIMGSAFIAYGGVLLLMLICGQALLARSGHSQEFYDSAVITAWGIVNTFTEHRWGQAWSHGDYQHTSMGIVWWCAGLVGLFLSKRNGQPRRNYVPALVIILTGWAMSVHAQHLELSTKIHAMFGMALMGAGFSRLVEVSFILHDAPSDCGNIRSFQYLPPFLLVASGFLFMFANEEQLIMINAAMIDHSSYTLVIYSVSFLVFFYFLVLIWLWQKTSGIENFSGVKYERANDDSSSGSYRRSGEVDEERQLAEAGEFELSADSDYTRHRI
ncbi:uncharacterized protein V1518DRAFT_158011 [Limtongia smithiae]|uniref:uncharacterized protein n=1 Tax=Limtongia smithiae TaxID=1125753 RepID=UPI0034CF67F7